MLEKWSDFGSNNLKKPNLFGQTNFSETSISGLRLNQEHYMIRY